MRPSRRLAAAALLLAVAAPQDPARRAAPAEAPPAAPADAPVAPAPPQDAAPLPPVADPPWLAVTRHDLLQRFAEPNPLEGTWRLKAAVRAGKPEPGASGYLLAGPRVLMFQLRLPDPAGGLAVQASTRSYRLRDGRLEMQVVAGHDSFGGAIRADVAGRYDMRQLDFVGGALRIVRDGANFMEFERLE